MCCKMINIIIISILLLSGTIVVSETTTEAINDVVIKTILSITNNSINREGDTMPAKKRINPNDLKRSTTKGLNPTTIYVLKNILKDSFNGDYIPKVQTNSEKLMIPIESYSEKTMKSVKKESTKQKQFSKVRSNPSIRSRSNCGCKVFSRCIHEDNCLQKYGIEPLIQSDESYSEKSMESIESGLIPQIQQEVHLNFNTQFPSNCKCKVFSRCVPSDMCLQNDDKEA